MDPQIRAQLRACKDAIVRKRVTAQPVVHTRSDASLSSNPVAGDRSINGGPNFNGAFP